MMIIILMLNKKLNLNFEMVSAFCLRLPRWGSRSRMCEDCGLNGVQLSKILIEATKYVAFCSLKTCQDIDVKKSRWLTWTSSLSLRVLLDNYQCNKHNTIATWNSNLVKFEQISIIERLDTIQQKDWSSLHPFSVWMQKSESCQQSKNLANVTSFFQRWMSHIQMIPFIKCILHTIVIPGAIKSVQFLQNPNNIYIGDNVYLISCFLTVAILQAHLQRSAYAAKDLLWQISCSQHFTRSQVSGC